MSEKPIRIQRKRTKGWRMPENTVYVGRGSAWGNPFKVGEILPGGHGEEQPRWGARRTAAQAVKEYAKMMDSYRHHGPTSGMDHLLISMANLGTIQAELKGKNLACWCPLDQPCHADWLLEVANDEVNYVNN